MGFRINTNIAALNSHNNGVINNRELDKSLGRLSSGLRINTAADDASGMAIADSLRSQANSLGQAVSNANDAIGIIQTADKAMDEQIKILDTIKTKAIQAASDTQNSSSRSAIQKDVTRLLEQLDNIAKTTSFNGQNLLSGTYTNKEYQVGAFSNQTIKASIDNTESLAIGNIATRNDVAQVGSFAQVSTAGVGSTVIAISAGNGVGGGDVGGLGVGDTIRIEGQGDFQIIGVSASDSQGGNYILNRGLDVSITAGSDPKVSVVNNAQENLGGAGTLFSAAGVTFSDIRGFAIGDQIRVSDSSGNVETMIIEGISAAAPSATGGALAGVVTFDTAATISAAGGTGPILVDRGTLGASFTNADFVQYTVEGAQLQGVQMTDSQGYGVVDTGLGRIADLLNSLTETTGIKALARVEATTSTRVTGGTLLNDMKINGITILEKGSSIVDSDSNNKLTTAINEQADKTGVSAALAPDGTLTLTSDGRAFRLEGFGLSGIPDGVVAGSLDLTKGNLENIDITAIHYGENTLRTVNTVAGNLNAIAESHNLRELVTGQVDTDKDGNLIEEEVGLLKTSEGAMLAMDIVESATIKLDATRADLGSVQNQLTVTINNISVTAVNVRAAESQIRDVDFAAESATFSKHNILAQSGSYAMSQANAIQQNVLSLLQ